SAQRSMRRVGPGGPSAPSRTLKHPRPAFGRPPQSELRTRRFLPCPADGVGIARYALLPTLSELAERATLSSDSYVLLGLCVDHNTDSSCRVFALRLLAICICALMGVQPDGY